MKLIAQCEMPDEYLSDWFAHLRRFEATHPDCHFEVIVQTGRTVSCKEMIETLKDSGLDIEEVFKRKSAS
jgi:hypothetical protein